MNAATPLPPTVRSLADVALIDAAAQHHELPCGEGTMAWRRWGECVVAVVVPH